jgi:predicted lipoprotein with Yx(FWY)xxD motif
MRRAARIATVALAAALAVAACGDDDDAAVTGTAAPTSTTAESTTTAAPAATTTAAPAASADATVTVASTTLGDVLADADGRTLYVFARDEPGTSNCTGGCLQTWPRYAPAAVVAGAGIDGSQLGSIAVDGVEQVTIDEQPLYYFAGDAAPGDVTGQGVGGNWWVVAPDGTPIEG